MGQDFYYNSNIVTTVHKMNVNTAVINRSIKIWLLSITDLLKLGETTIKCLLN